MKPAPTDIAENIRPFLSRQRDVVAAYLFGSSAAGRMRPGSDIDIAVLLDQAACKKDRKTLLESLIVPLSRALRADVHLLFLNDASYLVRSRVLSRGILLYAADKKQLALFRMKSTALYADFAPYMRMVRKGMQEKMSRPHGG